MRVEEILINYKMIGQFCPAKELKICTLWCHLVDIKVDIKSSRDTIYCLDD